MTKRVVFGVLGVGLLVGCSTRDASVLGGDPVKVTSSAVACSLSASKSLAGKVVFNVTNTDTKAASFSILANDGETVIGENKSIAPGSTGTLKVTLMPGGFLAACRPGNAGEGFRSPFEVTGENLK
jgi:iron uptake system component EfeO